MTLQTLEYNIEKRETQTVDILKCQLHGKDQSVKLLSYYPTTAVQLHMDGGKVADGFLHLIFHSIVSNIISWPFFLAFVSTDNDSKMEKEV